MSATSHSALRSKTVGGYRLDGAANATTVGAYDPNVEPHTTAVGGYDGEIARMIVQRWGVHGGHVGKQIGGLLQESGVLGDDPQAIRPVVMEVSGKLDTQELRSFATTVAGLSWVGVPVAVVHGSGNISPRTERSMSRIKQSAEDVGDQIAEALTRRSVRAEAISGVLQQTPRSVVVDTETIQTALQEGKLPIVSSMGRGAVAQSVYVPRRSAARLIAEALDAPRTVPAVPPAQLERAIFVG
jgi:hypothetical protein